MVWPTARRTPEGVGGSLPGRRRARPPSDEHGLGFPRRLLRRLLADQFAQPGDLPQTPDPILQVLPEAQPQLPARLLQAGERVPATPTRLTARRTADLPLLDVL